MKLLILRFSSIGDIVLTSPVVRALANAGHEVHYLTKAKFKVVLENNPYISKLYTFDKEITEVDSQLKEENYDYIVDLHSNIRTKRLNARLRLPIKTFNKLNYEKWLRVNLKLDILPPVHIVERYMNTVSFLNVKYDGLGLDYFITESDEAVFEKLSIIKSDIYTVFSVGGAHETKQIPKELMLDIAKQISGKIILLGGPDDVQKAKEICSGIGDRCTNLCGEISLNQSAAIVKYSSNILTADTGLMHIAAAFDRNIVAVWGNTIPEFGMYALLPDGSKNKVYNAEVKGLKCRPCSKIGYKKCPKKHFKCMLNQDLQAIVEAFI